ncbi:MAG TPA: VCBS repeat-containing protein [Kofleriaceae bacterium]
MRFISLLLLVGCGTVKSPPDMPPGDDDPTPACGDGIRSPGEVCYKPAVSLAADTPRKPQFADVDGDGDLDLVYLGYDPNGNDVIYTRINADGVFSSAIAGASTVGVHALARDYDSDGYADVAVAGVDANGTAAISMFKGDGTAHHTAGGSSALTFDPAGVAMGDVKGTGDLLVVFDTRTIILFTVAGDMTIAVDDRAAMPQLASGTVGELDGDGYMDLIAATYDGVLVVRGGDTLSPIITTPMMTLPQAIAVGDVTGDGLGDVAYATPESNVVGVMPGAGSGAFLEPLTAELADGVFGLELADVDGDGFLDVIAGGNALQVVLASDTGLAAPVTLPNTVFASSIQAGDFNGDDAPDLLVSSSTDGKIDVYESNP